MPRVRGKFRARLLRRYAKRLGVVAVFLLDFLPCLPEEQIRANGRAEDPPRIRIDTITGMAFSSLVSLAIVFATAATLHAHGKSPAMGRNASAACAEVAMSKSRCWHASDPVPMIPAANSANANSPGSAALRLARCSAGQALSTPDPTMPVPSNATIAVATLLGAALSLVGLDPVRALYWGSGGQRRARSPAYGRDDVDRP